MIYRIGVVSVIWILIFCYTCCSFKKKTLSVMSFVEYKFKFYSFLPPFPFLCVHCPVYYEIFLTQSLRHILCFLLKQLNVCCLYVGIQSSWNLFLCLAWNRDICLFFYNINSMLSWHKLWVVYPFPMKMSSFSYTKFPYVPESICRLFFCSISLCLILCQYCYLNY